MGSSITHLFRWGALSACLFLSALPARAHFYWMDFTGDASARLSFSEKPDEPTISSLLEKSRPDRAWTREKSSLAFKKGADAWLVDLDREAKIASAERTWGVLDRRKDGRGVFLLRYEAKAARDAESADAPVSSPVEALAQADGSVIRLKILKAGKPSSGAEVWARRPGYDEPALLKTDENGEVRFLYSGSGEIQVRAMVEDDSPGEWKGERYDLVRDYATLTFPVKEREESAEEMLKAARSLRETWGAGFPGFAGRLRIEKDRKAANGLVQVSAKGAVAVSLDDPDLKSEAASEIQSLVMHRMTSNGSTPDKPAFGAKDRNPLGRSILLNDAFESMYRIRDGQVMQVNRTMGAERFTIDTLHNEVLEDGRYLPSAYAVFYWDGNGEAKRTESYSERYAKTGAFWLPSERKHVSVGEGKISVTALTLTAIKLNDPAERTASAK